MSMLPASLDEIVESFEYPEDWVKYIHPRTGELVISSEEDVETFAEDGTTLEPPGEVLDRLAESLEAQGYVPLPDKFEVQEWSIMERFGLDRPDARERELILDAIHGVGAFRRFKDVIARLDLRVEWATFFRAALEDFAMRWLEDQDIPYQRHVTTE